MGRMKLSSVLMYSRIFFNVDSITQLSVVPIPPDDRAQIKRDSKSFVIMIRANPTNLRAGLQLLRY